MKNKQVLFPADILIPHALDFKKWSVVACDQYTSERKYWEDVANITSNVSSTYHLIFPEIYLENDGFDEKINSIKEKMDEYLTNGIFDKYSNSYIYVKRTLANGKVRNGIVAMVDLECYEYTKGATNLIRATEGTVVERIPPRVKIRQDCSLELPHIMLLIDDETKSVIEPIAQLAVKQSAIYSFDLMKNSGSVSGYVLDDECISILENGIDKLADTSGFEQKYGICGNPPLLFAVGDGNHSLATAKKCYENIKFDLGEAALSHPARFALVELVNLHDSSLEFEAIHRVMFNVDPNDVIKKLSEFYDINMNSSVGQCFKTVIGDDISDIQIINPKFNLTVGSLQDFIDYYIKNFNGRVDYIHGEEVVKELCHDNDDSVGFILNCMDKGELFKTVIIDGALPRKTFSMGEACDKRFYLEARKIKKN